MLWLKAFHIVGVVSWFAALLYLPRLFVYHAQIQGPDIPQATIDDTIGNARFKIMERKLFMIMTIGAVVATGFGVAMLALAPDYLLMRWLHLKLVLILVLIGYHGACFALLQQFASDRNGHSERWFRLFNELPAVLLVAIVILVVVKPF
jgi:putative membrane protein